METAEVTQKEIAHWQNLWIELCPRLKQCLHLKSVKPEKENNFDHSYCQLLE